MRSLIIGLVAGFFGGLVGLGGGVIMIPLMVRFAGLTQHQGHGTSLMALVFTGMTGAVTYSVNGSVDVLAAALLAVTAILTSSLGALSANALPELRLKMAFGVFLVLVALLLLAKPHLSRFAHPLAGGWPVVAAILASGAVAGFLSGMMGVGGGSIMVPALVLLVGHTQHTAQGSSLLAMVPAGGVGAVTHWRLGNVVSGLLWGLIPGIIMGTFLGGTLANVLQEATLRFIFAAVLIWLGVRDLRKARKWEAKEVQIGQQS
jgi:uncharacterized membrane protein YfcA